MLSAKKRGYGMREEKLPEGTGDGAVRPVKVWDLPVRLFTGFWLPWWSPPS
jgi:hypothetical protein